jgi:hypothetical protein
MALSSDLAGVFQIILAQQAAEARKEERQQDLALNLLSMEMREDLTERGYEIEAGKSMYNENMKIYQDAQKSLELLETEYHKAVGDVSALGKLYKASGNEVVRDIYQGEATDYSARADVAYSNAQQIKDQITTLQGTLYGDIKKAQNIMAGGAGFKGGVSPTEWDPGDLGLIAYEIQYGEASPTIQSLFKNNIGSVNESLLKLRKTEQTFDLTEMKMEYYEDKSTAAKVQAETDKAELMFGTISNSSLKTSGVQNLQALQIAAANLDPAEVAKIGSNNQAQFTLTKSIGSDFSKLIGRDVKPENYPDIADEYIEMHNLGTGDAQTGMGQTAYGNWSAYKGYVDDAASQYAEAVASGDTEKARILNDLAIKYFGMPPGVGLTQFAADIDNQFSRTVLATFNTDGLIDSKEIPIKNNPLDSDNREWEDLLDE